MVSSGLFALVLPLWSYLPGTSTTGWTSLPLSSSIIVSLTSLAGWLSALLAGSFLTVTVEPADGGRPSAQGVG